jgi:hypothetical protein
MIRITRSSSTFTRSFSVPPDPTIIVQIHNVHPALVVPLPLLLTQRQAVLENVLKHLLHPTPSLAGSFKVRVARGATHIDVFIQFSRQSPPFFHGDFALLGGHEVDLAPHHDAQTILVGCGQHRCEPRPGDDSKLHVHVVAIKEDNKTLGVGLNRRKQVTICFGQHHF